MADPDTVGARFDSVAQDRAAAIALSADAATLRYDELRALSDRIAAQLAARGYPGGSRIALLFEQGIEPIAMALGVLKAGFVFVQLDSKDPPVRLQAILQDCQPAAIVSRAADAASVRGLAGGAEALSFEELSAAAPQQRVAVTLAANAVAYILYTSGSTGEPKGVCQTHANLLHFVDVYAERLRIAAEDRVSMLYTLSFSAANMDIFGALLRGAMLCLYNTRQRGLADLPAWLRQNAITVLHTVPSVFRTLTAELDDAQRFEKVRVIDLGGEALYARDAQAHARHFSPACVLLNHYAATEASVIAQHDVVLADCVEGETLPVGLAAPGMAISVEREDGSAAEVGEIGAIVLRSRFLSPGYWRRDAQTEASFAADPQTPGLRSYRSGDLGYLDAHGWLHHVGRNDQRVKINGQSINLSEIEAALDGVATLRQHAVVVRGAAPAQWLAAFVVADAPEQRSAAALRRQLSATLPAYMVPRELLFLDAMPMTATGKIDRRALAESRQEEAQDAREYRAPVDELEAGIARLCEKVLERRPVGGDDDFFAIGGDSMRAIQLHMELEDHLERKIPLASLFKVATVAGMANCIRSLTEEAAVVDALPAVLVPLQRGGERPPLFLVHGRNAQAFVSPHFLEIIGAEQPLYAFQATGLDRTAKPHYSLTDMAEAYIEGLQAVQPEGPYLIGALCVGAILALEIATRLRAAGHAVAPLLLIDPNPFNPGDLPDAVRRRNLAQLDQDLAAVRQSSDHWLKQKLRERVQQGRISLDIGSASAVDAAAFAMIDFNIALLNYRLPIYDAPVLLLSTDDRLRQFKSGATNIIGKLKQVREVLRVGSSHADVLDVRNELFAAQLRKALGIVAGESWRAAAPAS